MSPRQATPYAFEVFYRQVVRGHEYEFLKRLDFPDMASAAAERQRIVVERRSELAAEGAYDIEVSGIDGPDVIRHYGERSHPVGADLFRPPDDREVPIF